MLTNVLLAFFYINIGLVTWYFASHQSQQQITPKQSPTKLSITEYHQTLQRYSQLHGMDWRFVMALIHAESSFQEDIISQAGAIGLMQVMPMVAREWEAGDMTIPEENIKTGIRHFKSYYAKIRGDTHQDRMMLTLAAYNAGAGHIFDAKRLAKKRGLEPHSWETMETILPEFEKKSVYSQTRYGYFQGRGVIYYVNRVMGLYQHYRTQYPYYPMVDETQYQHPMNIIPPTSTDLAMDELEETKKN